MKLNKKLTAISAVALMGIAPFVASNTAEAADSSTINKTVMHNSVVYDKNGKDTGKMYKSYQKVVVESGIVKINGGQYYKLADKDQYIKITNIDGVERTVEHNAYVYATSTKRANRRLVKKGTTIVTYGGSYKFKNGKRYYRVGGPAKQYVKVANLGDAVTTSASSNSSNSTVTNKNNTSLTNNSTLSPSDGETTVTVNVSRTPLYTEVSGKDAVQPSGKYAKKGDKFIVDRLEQGTRADTGRDGDDDWELAIYHIKGTDYWIYSNSVSAAKELPVHNYYHYYKSYIQFSKATDVYNIDGTIQNHNGQKIRKQSGLMGVDKLVYIWLPSEQKSELFYHLVGTSFSATTNSASQESTIEIGHNAYVKANDVKFVEESTKLTPSNTPEEAKATYEASQANTTK
ncbi:SLAP domain-containing protein [Lactobacillus sp. LL6]|uniref:SLAP domain-containing protein n=1 Tax=Lactobacillus sp. LL6 TaxID=2596827 RepID=UPI001185543E|nr:SLAP domain-containing protein [Lactobacillus sp. LL6]TSO26305.1 cell surface protein [Lactobacillus sp. LL6]